ncbi:MAG TPA: hypothetical protein VGM94_01115 [Galbitalea sp.]|jgi:hypothetical protein
MRIVDSRSGEDLAIGKTISYPDGESITLLDFRPRLFMARMRVRSVERDYSKPGYPLHTVEQWVDGPIRWFHPAFAGQRVAFFPS